MTLKIPARALWLIFAAAAPSLGSTSLIVPRPIAATPAGPLGEMRPALEAFLEAAREQGLALGIDASGLDLSRPDHQRALLPAAELLPENFATRTPAPQAADFSAAAAQVRTQTREEVEREIAAIDPGRSPTEEAAYSGAIRLMRLRSERSLYMEEGLRRRLDARVDAAVAAAGGQRRLRLEAFWALARQGLTHLLEAELARHGEGAEGAVLAAPSPPHRPDLSPGRPRPEGTADHAGIPVPEHRTISARRQAQSSELAQRAITLFAVHHLPALRVFEEAGLLPYFPAIAAHALDMRTRRRSDRAVVERMLEQLGVHDELAAEFEPALRALLAFSSRADEDPAAREFVSALARLEARRRYLEPRAWTPYRSPAPPVPGDVWDLGSLIDPERVFPALDRGAHRLFFDLSPYSVEYMREMKDLMREQGLPVDHIEPVQADIRTLAKPARPPAVIHLKNMFTYVPELVGSEDGPGRLEEMAGWLADGGRLVISGEPNADHRGFLISDLGPIARRLIARGWNFEFRLGGEEAGRETWDELIFTKPGAGSPPSASRSWEDFRRAARP